MQKVLVWQVPYNDILFSDLQEIFDAIQIGINPLGYNDLVIF